jgi:hypothetical protein
MIVKITNPMQRMIGCILIVLLSSVSLRVSRAQSLINLEDIQQIRALDLHQDGQVLAIGGRVNDQQGFWLYNMITGNIDVIETAGNVAFISWSPDGLRIAGDIGVGDATTFQIFDVASKQLLLSFEQTVSPPIILWDLNSSQVATTDGTTIYIRNVSSGNIDMTLSILPVETLYSLSSIAWDNSTNQRMYGLVGSNAKKILVWSTVTGELLQQYTIPFRSESLSLSPDFAKLAVGSLDGDGSILILDASNGATLATLQGPPDEFPQALVWQADSRHLASYGGRSDGGLLRTWDTVTAQQLHTIPVPGYVSSDELVWSADGSELIYSLIDDSIIIVRSTPSKYWPRSHHHRQ